MKLHTDHTLCFSRMIDISTLGQNEKKFDIEATEDECERLMNRFNIRELSDFKAEVVLIPVKENHFIMEADFSASAVQECVVTLEDVPTDVKGSLKILVVTNSTRLESLSVEEGVEEDEKLLYEFGIANADDVEHYETSQVDLGDILADYLCMELPPYPRHPSASEYLDTFNTKETEDEAPKLSKLGQGLKDLLDKKKA